jgi:hypothetical protein
MMVKKTEVLKCRIDSATLTALQALCNDTGRTISEALRLIIDRELAEFQKGSNLSPIEAEWSRSHKSKEDRAHCAQFLASIMIGPQPTEGNRLDSWRLKQRQVTGILESMFSVVEGARQEVETRDMGSRPPRLDYPPYVVSSTPGRDGEARQAV